MANDSEYFRRRAAEARSAAFQKDDGEGAEVAGHLALAYAALARRRESAAPIDSPGAVETGSASVADVEPMLLRD